MNTASTKGKKGFTMIETVVVIAVFALIIGALVSSLIFFYRANAFSIEQAFAVSSARRGVENLVENIRESTFSDEGSFPVVSIDEYEFSFYSDIDDDESIEEVRFFLDGDLLRRSTIESTGAPPEYDPSTEDFDTIADNVRNVEEEEPIFRYFDQDGAEITDFDDFSDIAFVRVSLIVNVNPDRLPNEFTLRSSAALRNLIDNT